MAGERNDGMVPLALFQTCSMKRRRRALHDPATEPAYFLLIASVSARVESGPVLRLA